MTDLFDDDLFAPRPAPAKVDWRTIAPPQPVDDDPPVHIDCPKRCLPFTWPVTSFACTCGFRDEVKQPAPDRLDCGGCKDLGSLRRYTPRYLPPRNGGRPLTEVERAGMRLGDHE